MKFQEAYMPNKDRYKCKEKKYDDGVTLQAHKDECDINKIIANYDKTGILVGASNKPLEYGVQSSVSLQEALNIVMEAGRQFEALPSDVRKKFDNDPEKFVEFVQNPDNQDEIKALGLTKREEAPAKVYVTNPTTEPKKASEKKKEGA